MLSANVAVKDLAVAKKFYEGTLGLTQVDAEGDEVIVYEERRHADQRLPLASSPGPTRRPP